MRRRVPAPSGKALYRVLAPGGRGMSSEQIAFHQRARLQGAMLAAVAESGYQDTSIKQLVSLAGVSRTSFYKLFENKEACFLATFDLIVGMASERIGRAYRSQTDWQEQMRAGFSYFAEIVAQEPDAAHLVLVDALGAGRHALERRDAATAVFEKMLAQSFARAPGQALVSETTIQMIIAGIRRIAYRRLLAGQPEQLVELTGDLLSWAISYHAPGVNPPTREATAVKTTGATHMSGARAQPRQGTPGARRQRREPPDSRQRILAAVTEIAIKDGYQALSMPAIAKQAGASNETFYHHFKNKQDAFLEAFEESTRHALAPAIAAFAAAESWPQAVRGCLTALLEQTAADQTFAQLAFFSILTAGPAGIQTAEQTLDSFTATFAPGYQQHPRVPEVIGEAIIGGTWSLIQRELANGRQAQLPELAPELTYITLTPFLGPERAAEAARG